MNHISKICNVNIHFAKRIKHVIENRQHIITSLENLYNNLDNITDIEKIFDAPAKPENTPVTIEQEYEQIRNSEFTKQWRSMPEYKRNLILNHDRDYYFRLKRHYQQRATG